jgi:CheY-like chemotaxis protein
MSRLAGYLWAFLRSQLGISSHVDPEEVLRQVSDSFVARGSMAPGVTQSVDLPMPYGMDESLLAFVVGRLAEMASRDGQCSISASALPPGAAELGDAILPPATGPFLSICVESGSPFPDSAGASGLLSDLESGMLSRRAELSLLQLIVVLSGGDCILSENRKRLSVILPGEQVSRDEREGETASGLSILLIDEDVSSRHLLARALRRLDFEVIQASDGVEGLRVARERKGDIDAVFISQHLHGLGGMETLLELRSLRPGIPTGLISPVGSTMRSPGTEGQDFVTILRRPFGSAEAAEAAKEMAAVIRRPAGEGDLEDRSQG